jgi:hypothetical protein
VQAEPFDDVENRAAQQAEVHRLRPAETDGSTVVATNRRPTGV